MRILNLLLLLLICSVAQAQFTEIQTLQSLHNGTMGFRYYTSADLNEDGLPDLVMADSWVPAISVGEYGSPVFFDSSYSFEHIFVADIDQDGDLDLLPQTVTHPQQSSPVGLLALFNEDGDFTLEQIIPGTFGALIDVADADSDGDTDLLVVVDQVLYWYLNENGFSDQNRAAILDYNSLPNYSETYMPAIADTNADGYMDVLSLHAGYTGEDLDMDVAIATYTSQSELSFLEDTAQVFTFSNMDYQLPYPQRPITVGDFNHDGHVDLVISGQYEMNFLPGQSTGNFTVFDTFAYSSLYALKLRLPDGDQLLLSPNYIQGPTLYDLSESFFSFVEVETLYSNSSFFAVDALGLGFEQLVESASGSCEINIHTLVSDSLAETTLLYNPSCRFANAIPFDQNHDDQIDLVLPNQGNKILRTLFYQESLPLESPSNPYAYSGNLDFLSLSNKRLIAKRSIYLLEFITDAEGQYQYVDTLANLAGMSYGRIFTTNFFLQQDINAIYHDPQTNLLSVRSVTGDTSKVDSLNLQHESSYSIELSLFDDKKDGDTDLFYSINSNLETEYGIYLIENNNGQLSTPIKFELPYRVRQLTPMNHNEDEQTDFLVRDDQNNVMILQQNADQNLEIVQVLATDIAQIEALVFDADLDGDQDIAAYLYSTTEGINPFLFLNTETGMSPSDLIGDGQNGGFFRAANIVGDPQPELIQYLHDPAYAVRIYSNDNVAPQAPLSVHHGEIQAGLQISPNPVRDQLSIHGLSHSGQYEILDIQGKWKDDGTLSPVNPSIDTHALSSGIYLLKLRVEDQTHNLRFLVSGRD